MNKKILAHFKVRDPILYPYLVASWPLEELKRAWPSAYFFRICREIVYQQLADKAASAIFARFQALFPNRRVAPSSVLEISHELMRNAGLSNAKARYIRDLAERVAKGELNFKNFSRFTDEQVVEELVKVKGIGQWTAEMFLMFTLAREDVFSHGDLGLRKAMKKIYGFRKEPAKKRVESIVKKWTPYKTYGCLALWAVADDDKK